MEKTEKMIKLVVTTQTPDKQYTIVYPSRDEQNLFMSDQLGEWAAAMANYQQEFEGVSKDSVMKISTSNKAYTTIDEILNVTRPITSKHGIVISQFINGHSITTMLVHSSGQFVGNTVNYAEYIASNQALAKAQTAGVVITYFKRYSLAAALGISVDEDSDGDEMAKKLGVGATAGDSPIEKALKTAFGSPTKEGDKIKSWFDPKKTTIEVAGKPYVITQASKQEQVIKWLESVAPQKLGASGANKDAVKELYNSLKTEA